MYKIYISLLISHVPLLLCASGSIEEEKYGVKYANKCEGIIKTN